ncbi:MAG: N-formylglutamate amidohydrolase [Alphaproteobacteria bacterium]|nr:N-formylglutamate amidohydrolase [Alphaproteobacteria bacterium]
MAIEFCGKQYKDSRFLLTADHAGSLIPESLNQLGLSASEAEEILQSHRCYDIGTEELTRKLSEKCQIPAIMTRYSRLVLDVNRHPDDPTTIRPIYDKRPIWGNDALADDVRAKRINDYFNPFHDAIDAHIDAAKASRAPLFLISIHSFTPQLQGQAKRKQDIAILYHQHQPFIADALKLLGKNGLIVGENEPYSSKGVFGYTLERHGTNQGIPALTIEYRQDYLQSEKIDYFVELTETLLDFLADFARVAE